MPQKTHAKLRGLYGKPLSKMAGQTLPLTTEQLHTAAKIILDAIKKEIRRDTNLAGAVRGRNDPVPIPKTKKFEESFEYRIRGQSTIEITSDWPTADAHVTKLKPGFVENMRPDKSAPIEMRWLSQPEVPFARIIQKDGQVVVRTTPDARKGQPYWVHPGFKKYTFLERGLRKGRIAAAEAIAAEVVANLLQENDLFG